MTDLTELGLSSYEEQAYRALSSTGPANARTVADRSSVPEGRIYDVLDGLEARGLVTTRTGEPRTYVPVDPGEAIDRLLAARLEELDATAERYRELAANARARLAPTPPADGNVWLASLGCEDSITLIGEQLSAATDRLVQTVGPPYDRAPFEAYASEVDAFLDHLGADVTVDLLIDRTLVDRLAEGIDRLSGVDADVTVKQLDGVDVTFDVVDGTEAYVDVPHPFVEGRRLGFVEVRDSDVARELEGVFDAVWADADPVP